MKFTIQIIFVFAFLAPLGRTQKLYFGKCPKHSLQPNFDLKKYTGTWYEVYRTFYIFELGYTCFKSEYEVIEEGRISIVNTGHNYLGHRVSKAGKGFADPRNPGKLMVKVGRAPYWSSYMVLKTDYDNYSIIWSCSPLTPLFHTEILWVLSRSRSLTWDKAREIDNHLNKNNIRRKSLKATVQKNCDFNFN